MTIMSALTVILQANNAAGGNAKNNKPIAPKPKTSQNNGTSNGITSTTDKVTSSTGNRNGNKRKLSFHPTLGYAIPPPIPAKVAKRNARERNRVKQVNGGFEVLRSHIPSAAKHKKMSKVETLRHAVEYIQSLQRLLSEQDLKSVISNASASDESTTPIKEEKSTTTIADSSVTSSSRSPSSEPSTPSSPINNSSIPPQFHHQTHFAPQQQYNLPDHQMMHLNSISAPLTPNTPSNTPMDFHGHHHVQHGLTMTSGFMDPVESGYETSSYYSTSTTSQLLMPSYGSNPSPTDSTSPSVFSDLTNHPFPSATTNIPMSYYDNSEEDELLDTIVSWQDQN